jgi:hypothetical protein
MENCGCRRVIAYSARGSFRSTDVNLTIPQARQDSRHGPDEIADAKCAARPEPITDPTADDLEESVSDAESREDIAIVGRGEIELLAELNRCCRDVHPVDIRDHVHQTQQEKNDAGRPMA